MRITSGTKVRSCESPLIWAPGAHAPDSHQYRNNIAATETATHTAGPGTPTVTPTATASVALVTLRGEVHKPGPDGEPRAHGQSTVAGVVVELFACDQQKKKQCLANPGDPLGSAVTDEHGRFTITVPTDLVEGNKIRVFVAYLDAERVIKLRLLKPPERSGAAAAVGLVAQVDPEDVVIDTISEATVRLLDEEGLETFTNEGIDAVSAAVEAANADTVFGDVTPEAAVEEALATAVNDPLVQQAVEAARVCLGMPCFQLFT
jgi:hypothetical protein